MASSSDESDSFIEAKSSRKRNVKRIILSSSSSSDETNDDERVEDENETSFQSNNSARKSSYLKRASFRQRQSSFIPETDSDDDANSNTNVETNTNSDEEDDDDAANGVIERMALSPSTRKSITGIRPDIITTTEDEDDEHEDTHSGNKNVSTASNGNELALSVENQNVTDNSSNELALSIDNQNVTENNSNELALSIENQNANTTQNSSALDRDILESSFSMLAINGRNVLKEISMNESEVIALNRLTDEIVINNKSIELSKHSENSYINSLETKDFENEHLSSVSADIVEKPINEDTSVFEVTNENMKTINISSDENEPEINLNDLSKAQPNETSTPASKRYVQPQAISSIRAKTKISQKIYDDESKKLESLNIERRKIENLLQLTPTLPDGGLKLRKILNELRTSIQHKEKYLSTVFVEQSPPPPPPENQNRNNVAAADVPKPKLSAMATISNVNPKINTLSWDDIQAATNAIQPKYTGERGLKTFNTQKLLTLDRLKQLHAPNDSCPNENELMEQPKGIKIPLMDHQRSALKWLLWREKQKPRGGILADDMGLGKTLTMLSLIVICNEMQEDADDEEEEEEEEEESDDDGKDDIASKKQNSWVAKGRQDDYYGGTLVVCPASLIYQWESEINTKVKRNALSVCLHHGNNRETKNKKLSKFDVVLTTYNIVSRDWPNGVLFGIKWERIVLDEAHIIRNHKTAVSTSVCNLKGIRRWVLTGTPINNRQMDLYALIKFLKCSPFNDLVVYKKFIENSQDRLNTVLKYLILRRTKLQLQQRGNFEKLPDKSSDIILVTLDKEEMNVYQKIMTYSRNLFEQYIRQRNGENNDYRQNTNYKQNKVQYDLLHQKATKMYGRANMEEIKSHHILLLLLRLRQICCHPGLIDAMLEDDDSVDTSMDGGQAGDIDLLQQLEKLNINDVNLLGSNGASTNENDEAVTDEVTKLSSKLLLKSNPVFDFNRPSSKMHAALKLIKDKILNSNDKIIIVSQWTTVLELIEKYLLKNSVRCLKLTGKVPVKARQPIVADFNRPDVGSKVLLLSLTAGGVGLNLIGANHILLLDPHWNPQLEVQAHDRIYRMGQKKNVHIYKMICQDTIEQSIKILQEKKLEIANNVLTGVKSSSASKLTIDDLKLLFGV